MQPSRALVTAIRDAEVTGDIPVAEMWRQLAEHRQEDAVLQAIATIERWREGADSVPEGGRARLEQRLSEYIEDAEADGHVQEAATLRAFAQNLRDRSECYLGYLKLREKVLESLV